MLLRNQITPRYSEYYNSSGQLVRIEQSSSVYQTLTYNTEGLLESVTHSLGGSLQLSYNGSGQLSQLSTPDNKTVSYSYDSLGNLTQVSTTYADGTTTNRTYHYEDSNHLYALTGITDEKGVRYASWSYNELGQAVSSTHANGADNTTLSFNENNSTTVTNALGKSTIFNYETLNGVRRLTSVEGAASINCQAANRGYTYYENGLIQSKADWNGNTTTYTYNTKHQQISRTEASGTASARTITTTWHESLDVPIQVSTPTQIIEYSYGNDSLLLNKTVRAVNGE